MICREMRPIFIDLYCDLGGGQKAIRQIEGNSRGAPIKFGRFKAFIEIRSTCGSMRNGQAS